MKNIVFLISGIVLSIVANAQSTWSLDKAHAKLGFYVTHMLVSEVEGSFKTFDVKVTSEGESFENAKVELTAEVASINTDVEKRDEHLKSADFFDVAKFPQITFKSTEFKLVEGKMYKLTGNLSMHGNTRWVTLNAKYNGTITHPYLKKQVAGFKITGTIKRSDFAIGASTPGGVVSDEVELNANIEIIKD